MKRFARTLAVSALLVASLPAWGQDQAALAQLKDQLAGIQSLRTVRPDDGLLVYYEAMTQAQLGDRAAALTALRSLLGRRLGLIPAAGLGFDDLWKDDEFQAVLRQLEAEEPRTPDAPEAVRLPKSAARLIPEGVAWDEAGQRFLIGSIARHKIVAVDRQGRMKEFSKPRDGLDEVLGLAVDAKRNRLYAVVTRGFDPEARPANAVVSYDLRRGRKLLRFEVAAAGQLNDVAVAPDGTVYASDSAAGSVFRMKPGARGFELVGEAGSAAGANGLAVAPDGRLYVTMSTGIGLLGLTEEGKIGRLPQPDSLVTGCLDGLYWHQAGAAGDLVGVQNGCNPGRVIRIHLAGDGRRIESVQVLQSHHHPAFHEPTTGAIVGSALYVLANSYIAAYQPDRIENESALTPPVLVAVPLDPAASAPVRSRGGLPGAPPDRIESP